MVSTLKWKTPPYHRNLYTIHLSVPTRSDYPANIAKLLQTCNEGNKPGNENNIIGEMNLLGRSTFAGQPGLGTPTSGKFSHDPPFFQCWRRLSHPCKATKITSLCTSKYSVADQGGFGGIKVRDEFYWMDCLKLTPPPRWDFQFPLLVIAAHHMSTTSSLRLS